MMNFKSYIFNMMDKTFPAYFGNMMGNSSRGYGMMGNEPWDSGFYMMSPFLGGPLLWIIILATIAAVIYFIIRNSKNNKNTDRTETPIEILKKRYARGEISKVEFDEIKRDL